MHSTLKKIRRHLARPDLYFRLREAVRRASGGTTTAATVAAITSSREAEGKTFVALTLALQAIDTGTERVLLIDADPGNRRSATRILINDAVAPGRDAAMGVPTDFPQMDLLSVGAGGDAEHSGSAAALAKLCEQARNHYGLTILDLPGLAEGGRVFGLLRCADGVVFVVQHRRFSVSQIRSYSSELPNMGVAVFGTVLNRRRYPIPGFIYNWL